MRKSEKVYILGTGNQAPYGIGEIIEVIPKAHIRKIIKLVGRYYNPPKMRLNDRNGPLLEIYWDYDNKNPELVLYHDQY
jgi:hypothetical protein